MISAVDYAFWFRLDDVVIGDQVIGDRLLVAILKTEAISPAEGGINH